MADDTRKVLVDIEIRSGETLQRLAQLRAQIEDLRQKQADEKRETDESRVAYEKYGQQIRTLQNEVRKYTREIQTTVKLQNVQEGSVEQLRAQLSQLTAQYNALSQAERESASGVQMQQKILDISNTLKATEEGVGDFRRSVGNYERTLRGLNIATAQIMRELPALGMNLNTFFLAISNNIPMLVDQIQELRMQNAATIAQGAKTVNVFKAVLKSLLSFNSVMSIGVTLLTLYGGKIVEWVAGLFKAEKQIDYTAEAQKRLNKAIDEAEVNSQAEITKLEFLYQAATDVTRAYGERKAAAEELKRLYPEYLGNMDTETILAGNAADAYTRLAANISEAARQQAKYNLMVENNETIERLKQQIEDSGEAFNKTLQEYRETTTWQQRLGDSLMAMFTGKRSNFEYATGHGAAVKAIEEAEAQIEKLMAQNEELEAAVQPSDIIEPVKTATEAVKEEAESIADWQDRLMEAIRKVRGALTDNEQRELIEIDEKYRELLAAYAIIEPPTRKEGESDEDFEARMDEYRTLMLMQVDLEDQKEQEITKVRQKYANSRVKELMEAVEQGYALDLAKFTDNEKEKLRVQTEMAESRLAALQSAYDSETDPEVKEGIAVDIAKEQANIRSLQLQASNNAMAAELEATEGFARKQYEVRKKYLDKQLEDGLISLDDYKKGIKDADKELAEARIKIAEQLADALTDSLSAINDYYTNTEEAQLEQEEERTQRKKDELQKRLDAGLISQEDYNTQMIQLDEQLEKKEREMERRQAQREKTMALIQVAIDTAMGIAKAVAQSPQTFGLPGSAIMAAVGAAQAAAIAAQPLPQAAKGMYIRGKSHAQGGVQIEAEGGEAIINKRSTAAFRPLLSAINEWGGGVKFAAGGYIPPYGGLRMTNDGGYLARYTVREAQQVTADMIRGLSKALSKQRIYTAVTDIRRGERRYTQIEDNAKF